MNAIRFPSGDHAGWVLCDGSLVTCRGTPPEIGSRNTWKNPSGAGAPAFETGKISGIGK